MPKYEVRCSNVSCNRIIPSNKKKYKKNLPSLSEGLELLGGGSPENGGFICLRCHAQVLNKTKTLNKKKWTFPRVDGTFPPENQKLTEIDRNRFTRSGMQYGTKEDNVIMDDEVSCTSRQAREIDRIAASFQFTSLPSADSVPTVDSELSQALSIGFSEFLDFCIL